MKKIEEFKDLLGETISAIDAEDGDDTVNVTLADGREFMLYHDQGCCECVSVESVVGDLSCLIGSPLLVCEERVADEPPDDADPDRYLDSETWTFYEMATVNGSVTIRWYGTSNGYYSESVDFKQVK